MNFAKVIRALRKERDLTQNVVAQSIGVTRQAIAAYENGNREPNFEILTKIANYYNVSIDYLFGRVAAKDYDVFVTGNNIRLLRNDMDYNQFSKDIGNKTGIAISPDKLELYETFKMKPQWGELLLLAKYANVETDFFYKNNSPESYEKIKKINGKRKCKNIKIDKYLNTMKIEKLREKKNFKEYLCLALKLEEHNCSVDKVLEILNIYIEYIMEKNEMI